MTAGKRRTLIGLERATITQDEYNEEVHAWVEAGREWAQVHYGLGSERRQAAAEQGQQAATFVVPDNSLTRDVKVKDRLTISEEEGEWDITQNVPGKPGEREITAVRPTQ